MYAKFYAWKQNPMRVMLHTVCHAIMQYFSETWISKKESSCWLDLECLSAILISKKVIKTNYWQNYTSFCIFCSIFCVFHSLLLVSQNRDPSESIQNMKLSIYTNYQAMSHIRSFEPYTILSLTSLTMNHMAKMDACNDKPNDHNGEVDSWHRQCNCRIEKDAKSC